MALDRDVINTLIAEAGGNLDGLHAVAAVVLNRAAKTGKTPVQVVRQTGQFQGYSNPGSASVQAQKDPQIRALAEQAFNDILSGAVPDPTNGSTSFRSASAAGSLHAPHGKVTIGGNTFARGSGSPQTAIAAIDQAVPPPLPIPRPDTLSAFANDMPSNPGIRATSIFPNGQTIDAQPPMPRVRPDPVMMPPQMAQLDPLLAGGHANNTAGLGGSANLFPSGINPAIYGGQYQTGPALSPGIRGGLGLTGAATPQVPVPSSGLTSRSVQTVPIDPMTGNPVTPQQTQRNTLQDALNSYALQQRAAQQGSIKTNGQAGQVGLPQGVVPQSAQRDLSALTIGGGQPMASSVLPKPSVAPLPSILGGLNYAQGSAHPYVPGPSGSVSSYKDPSQLQASAPLEYTTKTVMVPKQVPYISSTPPSSAILGGLGMTGGVLPKPTPTYKTIMVPQTVRVPVPSVPKPNVTMQQNPLLRGIGTAFNATPAGHITQLLTGQHPSGGLLGLLFGGGNPLQAGTQIAGNAYAQPAPVPGPQPGASFLQAQGQNTQGMTAGQVADALKAAVGSHTRGSFGV